MEALDAVVATPPFAHRQPVIFALEASKHVLCEKPFAMNAGEASEMADSVRAVGRALAVCCTRIRSNPLAPIAYDAVSSGAFGEFYHGRLVTLRRWGRPGFDMLKESAWFLDHARSGGGVIADLGHNFLDQKMWCLGWPEVMGVSANVTRNAIEPAVPAEIKNDVEEHVDVYIRLAGGKTLSVVFSWITHMEGANGIWLYGTEGGLRIGDEVVLFHDLYGKPVETRLPRPRRAEDPNVNRDFIEALCEGRDPVTTSEEGVVISKIVDAIYASSESQEEVKV